MDEHSINPIKYVLIFTLLPVVIAGLFLVPLFYTGAQSAQVSTSQTKTETTATAKKSNLQPAAVPNIMPFDFGKFFGGGDAAAKAGAPVLTIVNVEGRPEVYRIVNGLKHSLPTTQIFYSYGYSLGIVQKITSEELSQYKTARLFRVELDTKDENLSNQIYYLTEGGMLRPMISDKVFYSYGNRMEDVITINQKEFNYYPRNQFIYLERPTLDRNIYQITGGIKRYLTPVAVKRMDLKEEEIAPVNQIEFDAYPEGETVIF